MFRVLAVWLLLCSAASAATLIGGPGDPFSFLPGPWGPVGQPPNNPLPGNPGPVGPVANPGQLGSDTTASGPGANTPGQGSNSQDPLEEKDLGSDGFTPGTSPDTFTKDTDGDGTPDFDDPFPTDSSKGGSSWQAQLPPGSMGSLTANAKLPTNFSWLPTSVQKSCCSWQVDLTGLVQNLRVNFSTCPDTSTDLGQAIDGYREAGRGVLSLFMTLIFLRKYINTLWGYQGV